MYLTPLINNNSYMLIITITTWISFCLPIIAIKRAGLTMSRKNKVYVMCNSIRSPIPNCNSRSTLC